MAAGTRVIADWTVDVGTLSPSVDVPWEGWMDLRSDRRTDAIGKLVEAQAYPELGPLLEALNSRDLLTSKVDVFPVSREEVDPELPEAGMEQTAVGMGSYIDVVASRGEIFSGLARFESLARLVTGNLGKMELPLPCLAEVVVRPARLFGEETFGWTLYAIGFGSTVAEARAAWAAASAAVTRQMVEDVSTMADWWRNGKILSDASG